MSAQKKNPPLFENPIFINFILFSMNLGLFISKIVFSYLTNSLALQAYAFDNLTDLVLVFVALVGSILANKKPSEEFPYGYYKIENIIKVFRVKRIKRLDLCAYGKYIFLELEVD